MSLNSGFQIKIIDGPDLGELIPLDHTRITIGRARNQGARSTGWLLLSDKAVSREHAEFIWKPDAKAFHLRHLSKTNLTWVDENKLEGEIPVRAGQEIRVGKSRLLVEACPTDGAPEPVLDTPLAATGEITERINLGKMAASLALREGEAQSLKIVSGPDEGESHTLNGYQIAIGRECGEKADGDGEKSPKFDQVLNLSDPVLVPNHLVLRWDALQKSFHLRKASEAPEVRVCRSVDGFDWEAPVSNKGGFLQTGDQIKVGETTFEIRPPGHQSKQIAVKTLALPEG